MAKNNNLTDFLLDVANAIREKKGSSELINPQSFSSEIKYIQTGLSDPITKKILERTITEFIDDTIILIGAYGLCNCTDLVRVSLPNVIRLYSSAFFYCTALSDVFFPKLETADGSAFSNCVSLESIELPSLKSISKSLFYNCINLKAAVFSSPTSLKSDAFNQCSNLTALIITSSKYICTLESITAFRKTPIEAGTGNIYVPDDKVDLYKSATNWSTYASQIKGLSEIPLEIQELF